MRLIVTILTLAVIGVIASIVGSLLGGIDYWFGLVSELAILVILVGLFFLDAIREIPAEPPHKGIRVFLGKRQKKVLKEGLNYLPLYPIVFNAILVKVVKVNQDLPEQTVRTPDRVEIGVSVSITWTPGFASGTKEERAVALINFKNSGGEEGVKSIIQDVISDRLRRWAFSVEEGPADWEEATKAADEALAILIKAILGETIPAIDSPIPTSALLKYFSTPRKTLSKYEKKQWGRQTKGGSRWEGLENELAKLTPEQRAKLDEVVRKRREIIQQVRQGNGFFQKPSLGITINRFTVNSIVAKGEVAKAAELAKKEVHEREAERVELEHVGDMIDGLKRRGLTPADALDAVQSERRKATRTIEKKEFSIAAGTRETVEKVVESVGEKIAERVAKKIAQSLTEEKKP